MSGNAQTEETKLGALSKRRMVFSLRFVLVFLAAVALIAAYFWTQLHDHIMVIFCLFGVFATLALTAFPWLGLSIVVTAHIVLVLVLTFTFVTSAITWPKSQITVGYFAALVIGILIFLGFRKALGWSIVIAALIISLPWASTLFVLPEQFSQVQSAFNVVNGLAIIFITFSMVYLSDSFSRSLVAQLVSKKRALESTQEKLLNVQQYRNRFFSSISHEIRTPMNAIRGISELLTENKHLSSDDAALVGSLNRSSRHLLGIINDLLDVSKLEENKLRFVETDFDLHEVIKDASTIVQFSAKEKNIDFSVQVDAALPQFVRADPIRLRQVLVNLLNNAVKFTSHGHVSLRCHLQVAGEGVAQDVLHIQVQDTGIGIEPSMQKEIFDGYVQGSDSIALDYGGTGLGLNICRRIVENQGGKIWLTSDLGRGSTFYVDLPIHRSNNAVTHVPQQTRLDLTIQRACKIIIADDNKINVLVAHRQLSTRMPSTTFLQAENGQVVLDLLASGARPDVILMDMHMPILNGLQAAEKIRTDGDASIKAIPIIAMTANTSDEDIAKCYAVGMNDFISKPVDVNELLLKILKCLPASGAAGC